MAITRLGGATAITGTIPQGNIANASLGAVTALPASIPTGRVLQVVTTVDTTERSTTSTSFATASNGLSVNITPSSTSNKVYVIVSTATYNSTAAKSIYLTIYKGSTNLGNAQGLIRNLVQGSAAGSASTCAILNSPNTTSQVTYQVYLKTDSGGTALLNANTPGTITAFEIAG